jgi:hypothetical protein
MQALNDTACHVLVKQLLPGMVQVSAPSRLLAVFNG